jgi:hypothetical protein
MSQRLLSGESMPISRVGSGRGGAAVMHLKNVTTGEKLELKDSDRIEVTITITGDRAEDFYSFIRNSPDEQCIDMGAPILLSPHHTEESRRSGFSTITTIRLHNYSTVPKKEWIK